MPSSWLSIRQAQQFIKNALALLGGEDIVIDIGAAVHAAIDDDRQGDALSLRDLVVGFLLLNLGQVADDERPEIRQAQRGDDAHIVRADRNVLGDGDLEFAAGGLSGDAGMAEIEPGGVVQLAAREDAIDRGSLLAAAGEDAVEARSLQLGVARTKESKQTHRRK